MKQWHMVGVGVLVGAVFGVALWLRSGPPPAPAPAPQPAVAVSREQPAPVADTPAPAPQEQPVAVTASAPPPLPPPALPEASGPPKEVTIEPAQRKFAHGSVDHADQQ